jgi:hypothetical protein
LSLNSALPLLPLYLNVRSFTSMAFGPYSAMLGSGFGVMTGACWMVICVLGFFLSRRRPPDLSKILLTFRATLIDLNGLQRFSATKTTEDVGLLEDYEHIIDL